MNNKNIRPLCLSMWSPPLVRPQAILLGKMLPEWKRQGVNPVLVSFEDCRGWDIDIEKYYVPQKRSFGILNRVPIISDLFEKYYIDKIAKEIIKIITKHDCNILYSFAKPHISNIIGARVKELIGIPYVSHFSDPIVNNWFESRLHRKKQAKKQEKYIIEHSDRVIFIADQMQIDTMSKYPASWMEKARVINHCFQPTDYPDVKPESNQFVFSHVGIFRHDRNPEILLGATRKILDEDPNLADKLRLQFIGSTNKYTTFTKNELEKIIRKYNLEKQIEIIETISFVESLRYMKQAGCLVVIDVNRKRCPYILSKAIDYLGSGRPIIGIMPDDNPTAKLIKKAGYNSFNYEEVKKLSLHMRGLVTRKITPIPNWDYINNFTVKKTTKQLISQFKELIN